MGDLCYVRIWHDNSGKGNMASWYLKLIIIQDLQTDEKFYFLCEQWLAIEKFDGKIDRIIPVAGKLQKQELKYMFHQEAKKSFTDTHLWFSLFLRSPLSTFSRLQRLTCCFVILFFSMFLSILFQDINLKNNDDSISIGSFEINIREVSC